MKFTIRDLLWLTVVVALGVAWWVDRQRQHDHWAQQVNSVNQQVQRFDRQLRIYQDDDKLMRVYRIVRGSAWGAPTKPPSASALTPNLTSD